MEPSMAQGTQADNCPIGKPGFVVHEAGDLNPL
jgi:hypothetical protein